MNTRNTGAAVTRADIITSTKITAARLPSFAIVTTDDDRGIVIWHRNYTIFKADGMVGRLAVGTYHLGFRPGNPIVGGMANYVVAMLTSFNEMIERFVAIPPYLRCMIVYILRIPECRSKIPFTGTQAHP